MVDGETSKRDSRQTNSGNDEEDGKRCITVDVASRNQTHSWKYKSCNVHKTQTNLKQGQRT